jgi:catechol 2,3-dioxygenase-like lactoylglutathione lyase family enzyme
MMLNHIHFQVRDLKATIAWFQRILQLQPGFHNERIAVFSFCAFTVILDAASVDAPATLGFQSDDCDRDFRAVVERGAMAIDPPSNKEWGVRAAYFQGPGALKFEIEGPVVSS